MKVLIVTAAYPTKEMPASGIVVRDQVESLRSEGIEIDVLYVNGRRNKLNYLWAIPRLWAWLLTHHYDLIHAHHVFCGIIARAQFICPVVLTHHGFDEVSKTWERFPSHIMKSVVDKVIVVSQDMKQKLNYEKAMVIPCGISFDLFCPMPPGEAREQLGLSPRKRYVLWAGERFRREKRLDIVEVAIDITQEKVPSVELVIVSGQPHEVMPLYMNACDVLVLVSDGEGSPMVVKEAMACNLPIVSVPVGDVPELIAGVDGCHLCSQVPADVADKLLLALNRPGRTNGREKIRYLEQKTVAKRIVSIYAELLQEKRPGAIQRLGILRANVLQGKKRS